MPRIKLTKPGFANLTGPLLGAQFTNGVSNDVPLATIDAIAAAIGGDLVDGEGEVIGPAGRAYRHSTILPVNEWPRSESVFPEGAAIAERAEAAADRSEAAADRSNSEADRSTTEANRSEAAADRAEAAATPE